MLSNHGSLTGNIGFDRSTPFAYGFAAGTEISILGGYKTVEALSIGDMVVTQTGAVVPVKWIGRQTVKTLFSSPSIQPVRISSGGLGKGLPRSDLTITAHHGMIIDDMVINASSLVNGTTIGFVPMSELLDEVTYFHIETDTHDVILANGAAAETFVDYVGRQAFDNYQEYIDLYGCERIIPDMKRMRILAKRLVPKHICERLGLLSHNDAVEKDYADMMQRLDAA